MGLRGTRGSDGPSLRDLVESEGRPRLRHWVDRLSTENILQHAAVVYGYFPAVAKVMRCMCSPSRVRTLRCEYTFEFPRQQRSRFLCIADFIAPQIAHRRRTCRRAAVSGW